MGQVQRRHVGRVVEHGAQLRREQLDLVVAQIEAGQARHMNDVFPAQHHAALCPLLVVAHGRGDDSTPVTNSTVRDSISSLS